MARSKPFAMLCKSLVLWEKGGSKALLAAGVKALRLALALGSSQDGWVCSREVT